MNKKKYITFPIMLSLLCINTVSADCSEQAKKEFKEIEDQYKIIITPNREDKTYTMRIEEGNPNKFKYIFTIRYSYNCKEISNTVTECTGLKPGTSFYSKIIGKTQQCNEIVKENLIELERYNEFYGDPLCQGIEEFVLCQEFYNKEIDKETFEKRVDSYKKSKEQEKEESQIQKEPNLTSKTKQYIKENLVQLIIIMVFVILVIISIIVMIISSRKSRRLE